MSEQERRRPPGGAPGQPHPTGEDRVVPRDRGEARAGSAVARPRWLVLPPGEAEAPGAPAFDAPFHAGAEDAAGPLHA
jgi:hypothetical protein